MNNKYNGVFKMVTIFALFIAIGLSKVSAMDKLTKCMPIDLVCQRKFHH